jgi:hypothetical protein
MRDRCIWCRCHVCVCCVTCANERMNDRCQGCCDERRSELRRVRRCGRAVRVADTAFPVAVVDDSARLHTRRLPDAGAHVVAQSGTVDLPLVALLAADGRALLVLWPHDAALRRHVAAARRAARARRAPLHAGPIEQEFAIRLQMDAGLVARCLMVLLCSV